jgi:NAD(P)H dehydrogenase (quinone)
MNTTIKSILIPALLMMITTMATAQVNILVAYYSVDGHTKTLAEAVAAGATSIENVNVKMFTVQEISKEDLMEADAIIVGSPVYNANVAPAVAEFISSWPFAGSPLRNKIGAAFATGGGISAGEELTQLSILHSMLIFGMIIVGGPDWEQPFGASAITGEDPFIPEVKGQLDEMFIRKGKALGRRVAEISTQFNAEKQ